MDLGLSPDYVCHISQLGNVKLERHHRHNIPKRALHTIDALD